MKNVCILGATGSIGKQTLEVCKKAGYKVTGVTVNKNIKELSKICDEFQPYYAAVNDKNYYEEFEKENINVKSGFGLEGILECIRQSKADIVVNSIVGSAGIIPTYEAIKHSKRVALANKETLVAAGNIIMKHAGDNNCEIIPVDSEHSAVFQCIEGNRNNPIKKIILTASGGPFRGYTKDMLHNVTKAQALKHPNWDMGGKITIDSATLMNKGLEVIEAKWLFNVSYEQIEVVVHPESIVHSMVEFADNSVMAQLGAPDMRIPIQYAITYPKRMQNDFNKLNIFEIGKLEFTKPDTETFRCLKLAYEAGKTGGTMPCVLNAANEEAVSMFLNGKIKFWQISEIIESIMNMHNSKEADSLETILKYDSWARAAVSKVEV